MKINFKFHTFGDGWWFDLGIHRSSGIKNRKTLTIALGIFSIYII